MMKIGEGSTGRALRYKSKLECETLKSNQQKRYQQIIQKEFLYLTQLLMKRRDPSTSRVQLSHK